MAKVKNSCPKSWHNIQKILPTVIFWCEFTKNNGMLLQKSEKNSILMTTLIHKRISALIFFHNSDIIEGALEGSGKGQGRGKLIL